MRSEFIQILPDFFTPLSQGNFDEAWRILLESAGTTKDYNEQKGQADEQ